jgi:aryl-alcohol dehydrogenase-like predicted oxidoreductase
LTTIAEQQLQCSVGQMVLAWTLQNENVSTILLGASKPEQLVENLGAIGVARRMTAQHVGLIEGVLGNRPSRFQGFGGAGQRSISKLPRPRL